MRHSISQPLADDAFQSDIGACSIIYAEFDAIGISEIKFTKIAMQMLLAAMLIDALHAALKDGEIAFDSVGVDHIWLSVRKCHSVCVADIFIFAMIDGGMPSEVIAELIVGRQFIGHHAGFLSDISANNREQCRHSDAFHVEGAGRSAALDKS